MKKRLFYTFITILMLFGLMSVLCVAANAANTEGGYTRVDSDTVLFGLYPQSEVTDSALISTLDTLAGTLPTGANSYKWTDYGYYINGSVESYMWFIDVEENGEKYRGVYFTSYRPHSVDGDGTATYQDDNGYLTGNVYWFKYEPISWTILSENNGTALILCDMIIDSVQFSHKDGSQYDNYKDSTVRSWLNDTFYLTAFTGLQKQIILNTTIGNLGTNASESVDDKVFLLSYGELSTHMSAQEKREKQTTNYAQVQGAFTSFGKHGENGIWWLRSSYYDNAYHGRYVLVDGFVNYFYTDSVFNADYGIVPAMQISVSNVEHAHTEETIPGYAATCTEAGLTDGVKCSVCDMILVEQEEIPALGHSVLEWSITKEASCRSEGTEEGACSVCNTIIERIIEQLSHVFETKIVEPNCLQRGYEVEDCKNCTSTQNGKYIDPLGHDFVNGVCTRCKVMSEHILNITYFKSHFLLSDGLSTSYIETYEQYLQYLEDQSTYANSIGEYDEKYFENNSLITASILKNQGAGYETCIYAEVVNGVCQVFICMYDQPELPTLGGVATIAITNHNYVIQIPKEILNGCEKIEVYESSWEPSPIELLCEFVIHTPTVIEGFAATCTEAGLTDGVKCSVCDMILVEQEEIPAPGHNADAWTVIEEESCKSEGKYEGVCERCGLSVEKVVDKLPHEMITKHVEPSCLQKGYLTETCANCILLIQSGEYIDPLGHNFVNGVCTRCNFKSEHILNYTYKSDYQGTYLSAYIETYQQYLEYTASPNEKYNEKYFEENCLIITSFWRTYANGRYAYVCAEVVDNVFKVYACVYDHPTWEFLMAPAVMVAHNFTIEIPKALLDGCETIEVYDTSWEPKDDKLLNEYSVHTPQVIDAIDATCTTMGYTAGEKCSACGKILVEPQEVGFASHTEEIIPGKDATCTETGLTDGIKCSVCDTVLKEQEKIGLAEHTEEITPAVEATCAQTGLTEGKKCSVCGEILVEQEIVPTNGNHNYKDDICINCGEIKSAYTVVDEDTILFGSYPQAEVTDDALKSTLNSLAGTLPTSANAQKWTDYGYYENGSQKSYMWYIDVESGGAKYRGVYFTQYRPQRTDYNSSEDNTRQDDNGYYTDTVYWFRFEPISWTILSESNGAALIVCDMIIDSQGYGFSSSCYDQSTIRAWLNDNFYNTAFNELQREIILISTVDNSASSTGDDSNAYASDDTSDKIFLLSKEEASSLMSDTERQKKATKYALVNGAYYDGYDGWWLRSPSDSFGAGWVQFIGLNGTFGGTGYVEATSYGIVPALQIQL